MLTGFIVAIILQYVLILNHYAVYMKLISYISIIPQFFLKNQHIKKEEGLETLIRKNGRVSGSMAPPPES